MGVKPVFSAQLASKADQVLRARACNLHRSYQGEGGMAIEYGNAELLTPKRRSEFFCRTQKMLPDTAGQELDHATS